MYRRHLKHSRVKNLFKFVSTKLNTVLTVESSLVQRRPPETRSHLFQVREVETRLPAVTG